MLIAIIAVVLVCAAFIFMAIGNTFGFFICFGAFAILAAIVALCSDNQAEANDTAIADVCVACGKHPSAPNSMICYECQQKCDSKHRK